MTIIGNSYVVAKALDIIHEMPPRLGLKLNIRKTNIFWPSYDGNKVHGDLSPSDIKRMVLGTKLLAGVVSRDYGFVEFFSSRREMP